MDRLRNVLICAVTAFACVAGVREAGLRIRADDPIWSEPQPLSVGKLRPRKIDDTYDQLKNMFFPANVPEEGGTPRALGTNTLGEVPDSAWYTNRHGRRRMTIKGLMRGPGNDRPPEPTEKWTILSAKNEGVTPGFVIRDAAGRNYLLKFDTRRAPNTTTAVDVIGSKIFYALGYYTPENYIVTFSRDQLQVGENATVADIAGAKRKMTDYDVDKLLMQVNRGPDGSYRALASLFVEGELLGPWQYYNTRSDDPNDIYRHEHRRDVRGLYVFAAWLNHYDATSLNTLDTIVEENGVRFVRHYLIDFGSILGSSGIGVRDPRNGYVYQYDFDFGWKAALSLGLYAPKWQRADYPDLPEAGRIEADAFDPLNWKPIYPNPAFQNRLPDDDYWAAKKVMAFTDEDIRYLVQTGQYDDPATVTWLVDTLVKRRDKIGRAFFSRVLPLDNFAVVGNRLTFEDLAVTYGFREPLPVSAEWFRYNPAGGRGEQILARSLELPAELKSASTGAIAIASLRSKDNADPRRVDVYLRKTGNSTYQIAGIWRTW